MELVKTVQVLGKNKVSTSLKTQGPAYRQAGFTTSQTLLIYSPKVLTKPTPSIVLCTKEIKQTPLKI
jgi:hypothetical protein